MIPRVARIACSRHAQGSAAGRPSVCKYAISRSASILACSRTRTRTWKGIASGNSILAAMAVGGVSYATSNTPAAAEEKTVGISQLTVEMKTRLLAVNTAAMADADKEGIRVMDARLRPVGKAAKFVGIARTVQCFNDFLTVIKALDESAPGEVLVIDTQNSTRTVAGELFGTESVRRGIAAIVLDGPCRDTAQLAEMPLPVFIDGVRPISGTSNKIYKTQVPVTCGGVVVNPGDVVFGDEDGIIVCTVAEIEYLLPIAERIVESEEELLQGMKKGISLLDQLNYKEHIEKIAKGDANSKLAFKNAAG